MGLQNVASRNCNYDIDKRMRPRDVGAQTTKISATHKGRDMIRTKEKAIKTHKN